MDNGIPNLGENLPGRVIDLSTTMTDAEFKMALVQTIANLGNNLAAVAKFIVVSSQERDERSDKLIEVLTSIDTKLGELEVVDIPHVDGEELPSVQQVDA